MDRSLDIRPGLASMLCGLALMAASQHSLSQSRVYRCTSADGAVEFSQRPCGDGIDAQIVDIQDQRTGWVPPTPEAEPPQEKGKKRTKPATVDAPDRYAERCWKKRQQVERINNELRSGYKPARGERLRRQRREHEAFISEYCR